MSHHCMAATDSSVDGCPPFGPQLVQVAGGQGGRVVWLKHSTKHGHLYTGGPWEVAGPLEASPKMVLAWPPQTKVPVGTRILKKGNSCLALRKLPHKLQLL